MLSLLLNVQIISAHCDTMDGPVVKDAKKAIETNNVNYVLKWVRVEDEKEIKEDQRNYSITAGEGSHKQA
jgi:hypothetical protein